MYLYFSHNTQLLPSGKRLHNYGKSPFFMGKLTIPMAMFNRKLLVYQKVYSPNPSKSHIITLKFP